MIDQIIICYNLLRMCQLLTKNTYNTLYNLLTMYSSNFLVKYHNKIMFSSCSLSLTWSTSAENVCPFSADLPRWPIPPNSSSPLPSINSMVSLPINLSTLEPVSKTSLNMEDGMEATMPHLVSESVKNQVLQWSSNLGSRFKMNFRIRIRIRIRMVLFSK